MRTIEEALRELRKINEDVQDDSYEAAELGGEKIYCSDCGSKLHYDEDGAYCPDCRDKKVKDESLDENVEIAATYNKDLDCYEVPEKEKDWIW